MRFIHTADWHLGQTLLGRSRLEEQTAALEWLYDTCLEREADGLVVAGDIFDVASPAEDARKLYYDFLARLGQSPLRWVVVIAGNHDSVRMLSNVQAFARHFDISIHCTPAMDCRDDLVELRGSSGEVEAVLAAVPFLHEGFVRKSIAGQSHADKEAALAQGIHAHFDRLDVACEAAFPGLARIATGHLFATGSQARAGQDNIYVGNVRNLEAARLPDKLAYVALGHIHRPQTLPGANHVRYAGSLIPLDFAECVDEKGVWCVDLDAGMGTARPTWVASPVSRRLKQLRGSGNDLLAALEQFGGRHAGDTLRPWVEIELARDYADQKARAGLRAAAERVGVEILKFTRARSTEPRSADAAEPVIERLDELSVEEVFTRRLRASDLTGAAGQRVTDLFDGALAATRAGKTPEPVA